jgi:hypothetical protein
MGGLGLMGPYYAHINNKTIKNRLKKWEPYQKNNLRAGSIGQALEHLPCKHKATSTPSKMS